MTDRDKGTLVGFVLGAILGVMGAGMYFGNRAVNAERELGEQQARCAETRSKAPDCSRQALDATLEQLAVGGYADRILALNHMRECIAQGR